MKTIWWMRERVNDRGESSKGLSSKASDATRNFSGQVRFLEITTI